MYLTQQYRLAYDLSQNKRTKAMSMDNMEQTKCLKCRPIKRIHAQGRLQHSSVARRQ